MPNAAPSPALDDPTRPTLRVWTAVGCALALLGGLVWTGCGGCSKDAFATVADRSGDSVEFKHAEAGFADAPVGQELGLGDTVRTGDASRTTLRFTAGGTVKLGANSELIVGLQKEGEGGVTLKLGAGEMEVEATGAEFRLLVGDDKEPVILKSGKMMISLTGRGMILAVMDGEGKVERAGKSMTILSGQGLNLTEGGGPIDLQGTGFSFTLGGGGGGADAGVTVATDASGSPEATLAPSGEPDAGPDVADVVGDAVGDVADGDAAADTDATDATDTTDTDGGDTTDATDAAETADGEGDAGPSAPSSQVTLVDPKRKARVKQPDDTRFRRPKTARTPVVAGTSIKAKGGGTINGPGNTNIKLGRGAGVRWIGSGGGKASMSLSSGEARVVVRKGEGGARVVTKAATVDIGARGFTGNASVRRGRGKTRIAVRVGYADVRAGGKTIRVNGGQILVVYDNGKIEGPRSVGAARLGSFEGKKTRIYYDKRPARLGFRWGGKAGTPVTLEVARDEKFTKTVMKEPLEANTFTLAAPQGTYYWRVIRNGKPGVVGVVRLRGDPSLGRSASSVKNKVRDTGKETRIYFQGPHPRLTFSWKKNADAASYQMKLYRSSNLQSPLIKKKSSKNFVSLPANRLKEGTYFWYHSAHDASGGELSTGQMNKLSLTFDNKLPTLRIDSVRGGKVTGVAARGTGLTLNGKKVSVDGSGRFSMSFSSRPLIFRIKRSSGDTLFVRH